MKSPADSWTLNVPQNPRQGVDDQRRRLGMGRSHQTGKFFRAEPVDRERRVTVPAKWVGVGVVEVESKVAQKKRDSRQRLLVVTDVAL